MPRIIPAWLLNFSLQVFVASAKIPEAEFVVTFTPKYLYFGAHFISPSMSPSEERRGVPNFRWASLQYNILLLVQLMAISIPSRSFVNLT